MASMLTFLSQAASYLTGTALNTGCNVVLSCAGSSVVFPISPDGFKVTSPYNNNSVNICSLGDINMMGKRGLKTITFKSFFPAQNYSFLESLAESPYLYIKRLESYAEQNQPCRLAISGTNVNTPVTVENLSYEEKDGTSDVYFELNVREYRYILPASEKANLTTGLSSRVAESITEKSVAFYPGMDLMDCAANAVNKLFPINSQGEKQLKIFYALAKKGITAPAVLQITQQQLLVDGETVEL